VGIVIGLATYGYRVIATVGSKITEVTPSRGFSAEIGAAITILVGSKLGLPLSTTHTLVGAVVGVGFARGMSALNLGVIRSIIASWLLTIPFAAGLCIALFYLLRAVF
jgi:phosphate/sulfate permease